MLAYARLTPGPGFKPDRAVMYYAQRMVGLPLARRAVSSLIAAMLRRQHGSGGEAAFSDAGKRAVDDLKRDGLALLEPLLPPKAIETMREYFFSRGVVGPRGEEMPVERLPRGVSAAGYPLSTVLNCPGLLDVINAPEALGIASSYLGCKPTLSSVGVRWSLPNADGRTRTQDYHRDLDDWRFVKLFIYLTDVDEGSGPHSYVKGSHRTAFGVLAKAYEETDLERRYGSGSVTRVIGPRGTTFLADTLGIHCGLSPVHRPRLILQIQYSLLPIFAFLYEPAGRAEPHLDPYCNRLLIRAWG